MNLLRHALAAILVTAAANAAEIDFARDVYPILKKSCLACHNATKSKADLNLESPQLMRTGGESGPAVIPGKSAESLIFQASAHLDPDLEMPPPGNKVKATALTQEQLGVLQRWIDEGALGNAVAENTTPLEWTVPDSAPINAVAFSPDGRLIASTWGNRVGLCELATGHVIAELGDPQLAQIEPWQGRIVADREAVMSVAFGSNELLATGGYRTVRIWRKQPPTVGRDFGPLPEPPTALAVSDDGNWAAVGDAKGAVWLCALGPETFAPVNLKEHATPVTALAFSPDATALISTAADKSVRVWSVPDRAAVFKMDAPSPITGIAFLKGGSEVATASEDGLVRIWPWQSKPPFETPAPLHEFKLQDQPVSAIAPGDAGQLWWSGTDGAIHAIDTADGQEKRKVEREHPAALRVLSGTRNLQAAQLLAAARKTQFNAANDQSKKEIETGRHAGVTVEKARAEATRKQEEAEAARTAARTGDKPLQDAAKKADAAIEKAEAELRAATVNAELGLRRASESAAASAAAEIASVTADSAAIEAQAALEAAQKLAAQPRPELQMLAVSPDGVTALMVERNGTTLLCAMENGAILEPLVDPNIAAYLPNGDLLTIQADNHLRQINPHRAWVLERVIGAIDDSTTLSDRVLTLAFSPDGQLLATGGGTPSRTGELKLWKTADGTLVRTIEKPHADVVSALAFSPDGNLLASAGYDRNVRIWQVSDGAPRANFEGHSGYVLGVSWRADGLMLATSSADRSLRVWDVDQHKQVSTLNDFGAEVSAVTYVGGSDTVLAASGDTTIRLGGDRLSGSQGFLFTVASDPAGRWVAAGGADGVLRVWSAADRKMIREFPLPSPAPIAGP